MNIIRLAKSTDAASVLDIYAPYILKELFKLYSYYKLNIINLQ